MAGDGNCAMPTETSSTTVHRRTACAYFSTSSEPSSFWKLTRLSDARLHAVSSRNIYSEQGLDARIGPSAGQVCHSLMRSSYCTPGSAQSHAALPILSHNARALTVFITDLSRRPSSCQSPSASTASRKALGTRTELFEFCPLTVTYASPSKCVS